jgi:tetratricopeptide (TPR) repeat protein
VKYLVFLLIAVTVFSSSCNQNAPVTNPSFVDSVIVHYDSSQTERSLNGDMQFWQARLEKDPASLSTAATVAGDHVQRFHYYGDINDLQYADSVYQYLLSTQKEPEAGTLRSLSSVNMTRHRFAAGQQFAQRAYAVGSEKYASLSLYFDAAFELGNYALAKTILQQLYSTNQYGYFFRAAKYQHWQGNFDSAVAYMLKAAEWSGVSVKLKQTAWSNAADLYFHEGKMKAANELYEKSVRLDVSDYHSLIGIGKIALLHDDSITLAKKIFTFIQQKTKGPETLFYLGWVAEKMHDSIAYSNYAKQFEAIVTKPVYGNMYNKYLIQLYTGILHQPAKALALAEQELNNRSTPQTYSWYAWALHENGNDKKAMEIFKQYISGKPLEALELFWIGKLMKANGKNYNANEFFKAAAKNKYDLSPAQMEELEKGL